MEMRGIKVDREEAQRVLNYFVEQQLDAANRFRRAGFDGNVGSRDQLGAWLERAKAPLHRRTDIKKRLCVDKEAFDELVCAGWRPDVAEAGRDYFMYEKLASFARGFLVFSEWDGALHPNFNQCGHYEEGGGEAKPGARFARLSCSNPNLQQIPHHGLGTVAHPRWEEFGTMLRRCLVARPGYVLVCADVGQQEPRIAAHISGEQRLLDAFTGNRSVYGAFGESVFGYPIGKNTHPGEWDVAKKSILSFFWRGSSPKPWQERLVSMGSGLTLVEASWAYHRVYDAYPAIEGWRNKVKLEVMNNGYTRDWFGRMRGFPGAFSLDHGQREAAMREALNSHIQGPAASVIKVAMRRLWESLADRDAFPLLQVHDEVVLEVKKDSLDKVKPLLYNMCEGIMPIDFPVEIKVGENWGDVK